MKKNRKRAVVLVLILAMTISALTGCMGNQAVVDIHADGTCSFQIKYYYEKTMLDMLLMEGTSSDFVFTASGDFIQETETRYGKTYYSFSRSFSFSSTEEMKGFLTNADTYLETMKKDSKNPSVYTRDDFESPLFQNVTVDTTQFVGTLADSMDIGSTSGTDTQGMRDVWTTTGIILDIAVTLPSAVVESNGTVNGATASWSIENLPVDWKLMAFTYAGTMSGDTTPPTIQGAKNNGLYNKAVQLRAEDDVNIKSFQVNGRELDLALFVAGSTGKYRVTATDYAGNSTEISFQVDRKYPTIQGLKSGKIKKNGITLRFKDNIGIRSVKLNGKNVNKKKITVKKPGTYVIRVTDKAGNVTKRSFRIRKYTK